MKKSIPLKLLQTIEPLIAEKLHLIEPVINHNSLFYLKDKDEKSEFFFSISRGKVRGSFVIEYKPRHHESVSIFKGEVKVENIPTTFQKWTSLLEQYNETKSIYDDPVLKAYQKEFEAQFEIIDENANYESFNLEQQIYLDNYFTNVIKILEAKFVNKEEQAINPIIDDIKLLQNEQSSLSKNEVIKRLAKIWSLIRKHSISLLKQTFEVFHKEIVKNLVNKMIE